MGIRKVTTWLFKGAVPTVNEKATGNETFLAIHADSIFRNGKKATGTVQNLKREHMAPFNKETNEGVKGGADPTFTMTFDPETGDATISRTEGKRGRKERVATPVSNLQALGILKRAVAAPEATTTAPEATTTAPEGNTASAAPEGATAAPTAAPAS